MDSEFTNFGRSLLILRETIVDWGVHGLIFFADGGSSLVAQSLNHLLQSCGRVRLHFCKRQSAWQLQKNWFMVTHGNRASGFIIDHVPQLSVDFRVMNTCKFTCGVSGCIRLDSFQLDQSLVLLFSLVFVLSCVWWGLEKGQLGRDVQIWVWLSQLPVLLIHQDFVFLFLLLFVCLMAYWSSSRIASSTCKSRPTESKLRLKFLLFSFYILIRRHRISHDSVLLG